MALRPVKPQHETRTRILDAAEELFMQHGFEGTSMRQLTARAGVNLAAVNYHFGSKDALIEAVFKRRLDPMNAERVAALDALEKDGAALASVDIIRAFVVPSLRLIEDAKGGGRNFIRLLGRTYSEPAKAVRALIGQMYAPTMTLIPTMGASFLVESFVTVVVGGANVLLGTAPAGILLAGVRTVLNGWGGQTIGQIGMLLTVIVVIRLLPDGLSGWLGRRTR